MITRFCTLSCCVALFSAASLQAQSPDPESRTITSLQGTPVTLRAFVLNDDYQLEIDSTDVLCFPDVWNGFEMSVLGGKFLRIRYRVGAGSGFASYCIALVCVSHGKLVLSLIITSELSDDGGEHYDDSAGVDQISDELQGYTTNLSFLADTLPCPLTIFSKSFYESSAFPSRNYDSGSVSQLIFDPDNLIWYNKVDSIGARGNRVITYHVDLGMGYEYAWRDGQWFEGGADAGIKLETKCAP